MLPPPPIITRLTGLSMRRSSRMMPRMCSVAAMKNTSSPASINCGGVGDDRLSWRKMAATRVSRLGRCCCVWSAVPGDQRPAVKRPYRDQADQAPGEFQHLQRFRKLDQLWRCSQVSTCSGQITVSTAKFSGENILRMRE